MEFTKNKYLKEMFEYRKILKTYPEFIPQFSFDNIVEFYESTEFDYFDFQQYSIPFFEDLSTLEYIDLLFSWIDKKLQHDGYTKYRGNLYGKDILEYAINKGGINCLMHGIILQEILIKSGFKAHLVQCNPFDYKIGDCHWLINLFIPEFNKWMMIDPVWLGFCTDTDNIPLDFFEIRKSIIENQKICINKKNKSSYYEYLMCRYLFFFGFFEKNGVGTFEEKGQKKVYVAPEGFNAKDFVRDKEVNRFLPYNIKEYLYFSRFEENAKFI